MQEFENDAESGDQYNFMQSKSIANVKSGLILDLLHFSSSTITDYSKITNPWIIFNKNIDTDFTITICMP